MRNLKNPDEDGNDYDYLPNELAELSRNDPRLYKEVVESNLDDNDSIEDWENRNLEWAKDCLAEQRRNRKSN